MTGVWNYYCIYPGSLDRLDLTVRRVVAEAVLACAGEPGWKGWFFIRYLDEMGPHIRFRFLASSEASGSLQERVEAIIAGSLPEVAAASISAPRRLLPFPADKAPESKGAVSYFRAEYEPEYAKYGGSVGVALAERLFERSSEIALELMEAEEKGASDRVVFALCAMQAAIETAIPKVRARSAFLKRYVHYWSGEDRPGAEPLRNNLLAAGERRKDKVATQLMRQNGTPTAQLAEKYRADLVETFRSASTDATIRTGPEDLCFHYIHMMNNRLGILPVEEAYLASLLLGAQNELAEKPANVGADNPEGR